VALDLSADKADVNVVFVTNRRIRELNRRFLGRDRPTDVISFNLPEPPLPGTRSGRATVPRLLGEVYVSRDQARIQARDFAVPVRSELRRLVLHGLLHLLGLSHKQMEPLYRRYLDVK
jgi:probable rRNA maturation factor